MTVVVARTKPSGLEYMTQSESQVAWTDAAQAAAQFRTVRDATRAAMRLPSSLRAFALPVHA